MMGPVSRRYDMTGRAAAVGETRDRIVGAACAVFARDGFRMASIQSVAREADLSPATVCNHFASTGELLEAALEAMVGDVGLPSPRDIEAAGALEPRIARLAHGLAASWERSEKWYALYVRDQDVPALRAAHDAFFRKVDALVQAALGPGRRDKKTVAVASALLGPATHYALRAAGMSDRSAAATVAGVITSWLKGRST
jgi:AcrR family transcriptional regulator